MNKKISNEEREISQLLRRGRKNINKNILTREQRDILEKNMNISEDEEIAKEYPGARSIGHLGEISDEKHNFYRLWLWIDKNGYKIVTLDQGNGCCTVVQVFKKDGKK